MREPKKKAVQWDCYCDSFEDCPEYVCEACERLVDYEEYDWFDPSLDDDDDVEEQG